jgi:hypothetical protein
MTFQIMFHPFNSLKDGFFLRVVRPNILSLVQFWIKSMISAVGIFAPRARFIPRAIANFLDDPLTAGIFVAFVARAVSGCAAKRDEQKK